MKQKYYLASFAPTRDDIGKPVYLTSGQACALVGIGEPLGTIKSLWRDAYGVYAVKI